MAKPSDWRDGMNQFSEECPVCHEVFLVTREASPSMAEAQKAVKLRIATHHYKTREDFSQAAARIVREATERD